MIIATDFGHINRKRPFQNAAFLGKHAVFGNNVFHVGSHFLCQAPHQVISLIKFELATMQESLLT